jgi:phospholipid/cholesterol/gamma-HCH transport system ATP-binding protein
VKEPGAQPIIIVEHLRAEFGDNLIFRDVSFQVRRGEIFVILGGSGCGKTTLLKHLIGLYRPSAGKVLVNGVDIVAQDPAEMELVRKGTGMLFQAGALFGSMTLAENVAVPLQQYTRLPQEEIDRIVKMKLSLVNLSGYDNHLPEELSGGMKKRAGLARAMALDPPILFFDEPSAGLDPISAVELDLLIKGLNAALGTTMVIVTHELQSIYFIADRIIMLDKETKGIIAEGDPRELRDTATDPKVANFFNRKPAGEEYLRLAQKLQLAISPAAGGQ